MNNLGGCFETFKTMCTPDNWKFFLFSMRRQIGIWPLSKDNFNKDIETTTGKMKGCDYGLVTRIAITIERRMFLGSAETNETGCNRLSCTFAPLLLGYQIS